MFTNLSKDIYDLTYRESIWEIEFKGNNQDGHTTGGCVGSYNGVYNNQNDAYGFGYGYVSVTLKLFDLFDDPNDVRREWNICEYYYRNGEKLWRNLNNKQYVYCNAGKFRREYELSDTKDKDYTPINFPVLRYSDVLLMLAEAENESLRRSDDSGVRMYQRGAPTGQFRPSGCRRSRSGGFPPAHH